MVFPVWCLGLAVIGVNETCCGGRPLDSKNELCCEKYKPQRKENLEDDRCCYIDEGTFKTYSSTNSNVICVPGENLHQLPLGHDANCGSTYRPYNTATQTCCRGKFGGNYSLSFIFIY